MKRLFVFHIFQQPSLPPRVRSREQRSVAAQLLCIVAFLSKLLTRTSFAAHLQAAPDCSNAYLRPYPTGTPMHMADTDGSKGINRNGANQEPSSRVALSCRHDDLNLHYELKAHPSRFV
mmetsp:Transcript_13313/g.40355  ORF Transcript_13313/g.40355 Transcript_13313/m.40355 type:complete len:119 (-) Transcript_13313:50-406(-)|eukprot:scaffold58929_cov24-Tisochrysis_lutea.AAC.2